MTPDAEITAEEWAKNDTELNVLLHDRVATRLPRPLDTSPFLRVVGVESESLLAETEDVRTALLQWDAYAFKGHRPTPDWKMASLVIRTLLERLAAVSGVAVPQQGYVLDFSQMTGPRRVEETTGWARFRLDCLMAIRSTS